jgi:tetratricopeptide (TPR) repeat protein
MTEIARGAGIIALAMAALTAASCAKAANIDAVFMDSYVQAAGGPEYQKQVDAAIAFFKAKQYDQALLHFQKADSVPILEAPNYELMPVIAWLQYKQGKFRDAEETVAEADLVLDVLIGKAKCEETNPGWALKSPGVQNRSTVNRVENRMCSAFLEDYLHPISWSGDAAFAGRLYVVKRLRESAAK